MTKILLLDSNSLINRAFYALPPLSNKDGIYTNAVYGYLSMLAKLINEHGFTHIGAVFDLKAPTFRHLRYEAYKGTRKLMPEELAMQVPILKELLGYMGIPVITKEGYEADDIIGTLAKRFKEETVIVSGDRDVLQLVDESTVVFNTKRGVTDIKVYDIAALKEEGFEPYQIIEYKALSGDSSDNIPGCPGVGEKTAKGLLESYQNVEGVYAHIDEIKGKLKERLELNKDMVLLSKELATINTNSPVEMTLEGLEFKGNFSPDFVRRLTELECKTLIPRFKKSPQTVSEGIEKNEVVDEPEVFSDKPDAREVKILSAGDLEDAIKNAKDEFALVLDKDLRFAFDGETEYIVDPKLDLLSEGMDIDEAISILKPLFEGDKKKIFYDAKALMHSLEPYGISIAKPYEDTLLMSYLLDVTKAPKSAEDLVSAYGYKQTAVGIAGVYKTLVEKLKNGDLETLYKDIELPLIEVLFDMEKTGFLVDTGVLDTLADRYAKLIADISEEIYAANDGEKFNINSPQQLAHILFEKLNLPHGKKTKTGYSVSADILEELNHPIVTLILKYRKFVKLQSTYILGMRSVIDSSDGRVHTVFKQCLTQTGRLSSTEPNLQNIPIRTEEGREIRKMFIPSKGNILVSADYSQIELRLLAHFSKDDVLTDAYVSGKDIHAITASKIYGVDLDEVTENMRRSAKRVNFGIIYGMSAFGLANAVGTTPYEAKVFQEKYFESYPSVKTYMRGNVDFAVKHGYIKTLAGRVRYFPEFASPNRNIRAFGERAAMNMPLQGSAADIIKIAMINVFKALKDGGFKAKLILQVHDELVLDVPESEAEAVRKLLVDCMENAVKLNVPLIADAESGTDWFSVK